MMAETLGFAVAAPLAAAVAAGLMPPRRAHWAGRALALALAVSLAALWSGGWRLPDFLSAWLYSVVAGLSLFGLWYSEGYIAAEASQHGWDGRRLRSYWLWLFAFIGALLALAAVANYLLLWVAMEAATLTSVFLTAVPGDSRAAEAAWKYLLVTEAGGFAALLGTVMVVTGSGRSLTAWAFAPPVTAALDGHRLLIGAALVLLGYATKAGLAPFHTWLPDAHSEAPAPVSALLSGLKLAAALVLIYRLFALTAPTVPVAWLQGGLIALGLASLLVAATMVAYQQDLKRLWAYSSIEHMGLISLGMGFGGVALVGAFLHIMTHAASKTLLFQQSGTVRLLYRTSRADAGARGILLRSPWSGSLLALGAAAIAGVPPLAPFWSEWLILAGGFQAPGRAWAAGLAAAMLVAIFIGMAWRMPKWLWVPGPVGGSARPLRLRESWALLAPGLALSTAVVGGGLGVPWLLGGTWQQWAMAIQLRPF